jgi:hypothetical protein
MWTGWIKLDVERGWRLVARAATWEACWRELLALRPRASFLEMLVNKGNHPDHRRRPR